MELLVIYLVIGMILSTIVEIYNVKKYGSDSYTGYIVGIWKDEKSLAVRSKLIIGYICLFIAACILWLPIIIFDSVNFILERLNK